MSDLSKERAGFLDIGLSTKSINPKKRIKQTNILIEHYKNRQCSTSQTKMKPKMNLYCRSPRLRCNTSESRTSSRSWTSVRRATSRCPADASSGSVWTTGACCSRAPTTLRTTPPGKRLSINVFFSVQVYYLYDAHK